MSSPTAALAEAYNKQAESYSKMMDGEIKSKAALYNRILGEITKAKLSYSSTSKFDEPVLDVSVGSGHVLKYIGGALKRESGSEIPLFGSDISPEMIKKAQALVPSGNFAVGNMCDLKQQFPDNNKFGVIVNLFAIHHVEWEGVEASFKETARLLKNGGGVFALGFWECGKKAEHGTAIDGCPEDWGRTHMWQIKQVKELLEKTGFEIVSSFEQMETEFEMNMGFVFARM